MEEPKVTLKELIECRERDVRELADAVRTLDSFCVPLPNLLRQRLRETRNEVTRLEKEMEACEERERHNEFERS
jgi:hypothetical protein